jgi:hypothetical protein
LSLKPTLFPAADRRIRWVAFTTLGRRKSVTTSQVSRKKARPVMLEGWWLFGLLYEIVAKIGLAIPAYNSDFRQA